MQSKYNINWLQRRSKHTVYIITNVNNNIYTDYTYNGTFNNNIITYYDVTYAYF